jgi:Flp pilus assembly protein TadG
MKVLPDHSGARRGRGASLQAAPRTPSQSGWVAVFAAMLGLVLIAFIGVAIDLAYSWTTAHQLQKAADAASMAGARVVKNDYLNNVYQYANVRQAAVTTAAANTAAGVAVAVDPNPSNTAGGEVVVGRWNPITKVFTPDNGSGPAPDSVKVVASRMAGAHGPLTLLFGYIFNSTTSQMTRSAIARLAPPDFPLILVLDLAVPKALRLDGSSATMDATAGTVHVNSDKPNAVELNGSPTLIAQKLSMVGNISGSAPLVPIIQPGAAIKIDPLLSLPYPDPDPNTGLPMPKPFGPSGQIIAAGTYSPGSYPKGINLNSGTAVLLPGRYSFGSMAGTKGIDLKGSALVTGVGVMIFVDKNAVVDISGSGAGMTLTPQSSGTYQGVTLFCHRLNSGNKACSIGGGGIFDLQGTLYVPKGHLDMSGTPGKKIGSIIVNTLEVSGTCGFTITGIGIPPPPPQPEYVFLVQ